MGGGGAGAKQTKKIKNIWSFKGMLMWKMEGIGAFLRYCPMLMYNSRRLRILECCDIFVETEDDSVLVFCCCVYHLSPGQILLIVATVGYRLY